LATDGAKASALPVLLASLRLGCSSFGGPVAHLGYFQRSYVERRGWIDGQTFAGIVALCQLLPGPTSSQVGFLVGWHRAGWLGALAAWLGFTLPAAILMYAFALVAPRWHGPITDAVLHGLKMAAVAVVAQAVWSMARSLCPDLRRALLALAAAAGMWLGHGIWAQFFVLALGALAGLFLCRGMQFPAQRSFEIGARTAGWALTAFLVLLVATSLLAARFPHGLGALAAIFYRSGAFVFGGGHVVLPLLRAALVPGGWVSDDVFLTGYGAAQAMPGPLFTFAAYLGAAAAPSGSVGLWAAAAVICIFLPGLLLAVGGLVLWRYAARLPRAGAALAGVNAAVVGILGAALYDPVWVTAIRGGADVATAIAGFLLLERARVAPLVVVALCLCAALLVARIT
jgi:chromate transporter